MSVMISNLGPGGSFTGFGTFGDAISDAFWKVNEMFDAFTKQGVTGNALRKALELWQGVASQAPDEVRYAFMYEVDSRAELQSDAKLPTWLLAQIRERLKAVIKATGASSSTMDLLAQMPNVVAKNAPKSPTTTVTIAPSKTPGQPPAVLLGPVAAPRDDGGFIGFVKENALPLAIAGAGIVGRARLEAHHQDVVEGPGLLLIELCARDRQIHRSVEDQARQPVGMRGRVGLRELRAVTFAV